MKDSNTKNKDFFHEYDDDNIPEIDTQNTKDVIPDEVPRRDGPGG